MNEKVGEVFSIGEDNKVIPGCTVSKEVYKGSNSIRYFSMDKNTDISAEIYPVNKLFFLVNGSMEVYGKEINKKLVEGEFILTPIETPVGVRSEEGVVFVEIYMSEEEIMNNQIEIGEVFNLSDLVPYSEGKIVNMDFMHSDHMKFALMAFDEGTELSEHAAPGEALIFALDGEGTIGYEGEEHLIKAGENFVFERGGKHYVKANKGKFKMALLLIID